MTAILYAALSKSRKTTSPRLGNPCEVRTSSGIVGRFLCSPRWFLLLAGFAIICQLRGQESPDPRPSSNSFQTNVVQDVVAQYLMNPDGFVDGLLLTNNMIVRFPPHLGQVLIQTVSPQDVVRVEGFFESPGTLHALSIIDLQSQRSIVDSPPPLGRPPSPRPGSLPRQPLSATGTIRVLTRGKQSEINGLVLSDGTFIHFPPAAGVQFASLLSEGKSLAATGYGISNRYGRSLEAVAIGPSLDQLERIALEPGSEPTPATGPPRPPHP
jgi:hypothetical protein